MASNISSEKEGEGRDVISDLPDTILHHILSFLELKQAITSSVLSKKWRYVWASLPCLKFDVNSFKDTHRARKAESFKRFVNQVYNLRDNSSNIQILSLSCYGLHSPMDIYEYNIKRCVGEWIGTSLKHNLQELYIKLTIVDFSSMFPSNLFTCNSLTRLELEASIDSYQLFIIDQYGSFSLPRLKTLLLKFVKFVLHDTSDKLFSGCPVLESLTIANCVFKQRELRIIALKLEHLVIELFMDKMERMKIRLNTPNLVSIRCKDFMSRDFCVEHHDLCSLVKAELDFIPKYDMRGGLRFYDNAKLQTSVVRMMRTLREFHNIQVLTLSPSFFEGFHNDPSKVQNIFSTTTIQFCKLRCLKLEIWGTYATLVVITYLLLSSPNTESLIMKIYKDPYLRKSSPYWYEVDLITSRATLDYLWKHGERSVAWETHCLKLVEIRGLEGSFDELCFLRHLLEYGIVLEKLIIYPSKEWLRHPNRRLDSFVNETLLSFTRASSTVEIIMF